MPMTYKINSSVIKCLLIERFALYYLDKTRQDLHPSKKEYQKKVPRPVKTCYNMVETHNFMEKYLLELVSTELHNGN